MPCIRQDLQIMESFRDRLNKNNIPEHVAIIMDGNGRWAKKQGISRIFGHQKGVDAVRITVEAAGEVGIKYLTLYAFSTENWERPKYEVDALMTLLVQTVEAETESLMKNNVSLSVIGDISKMPKKVRKKLNNCIEVLGANTGLKLILALSYSSHWEILEAVKNITVDSQNGKIVPEDINEKLFRKYLATANYPDPELLIRTSGEQRISNFLLWQIVYTELYFTNKLWPDFGKEDLYKAIYDYQNRERRFGKISEQLNS